MTLLDDALLLQASAAGARQPPAGRAPESAAAWACGAPPAHLASIEQLARHGSGGISSALAATHAGSELAPIVAAPGAPVRPGLGAGPAQALALAQGGAPWTPFWAPGLPPGRVAEFAVQQLQQLQQQPALSASSACSNNRAWASPATGADDYGGADSADSADSAGGGRPAEGPSRPAAAHDGGASCGADADRVRVLHLRLALVERQLQAAHAENVRLASSSTAAAAALAAALKRRADRESRLAAAAAGAGSGSNGPLRKRPRHGGDEGTSGQQLQQADSAPLLRLPHHPLSPGGLALQAYLAALPPCPAARPRGSGWAP